MSQVENQEIKLNEPGIKIKSQIPYTKQSSNRTLGTKMDNHHPQPPSAVSPIAAFDSLPDSFPSPPQVKSPKIQSNEYKVDWAQRQAFGKKKKSNMLD